MPKFLRRSVDRYSKLGLRRKKKQIWRKPTGRDNKMREKLKGYPAVVSIGYGTDKIGRGQINGKESIIVNNIKDLEKVKKNNIVIIGKIGKKKKIEIINKVKEMKLDIFNVNMKKFLKQVDREIKFKEKKKIEDKKTEDKKAKKKHRSVYPKLQSKAARKQNKKVEEKVIKKQDDKKDKVTPLSVPQSTELGGKEKI